MTVLPCSSLASCSSLLVVFCGSLEQRRTPPLYLWYFRAFLVLIMSHTKVTRDPSKPTRLCQPSKRLILANKMWTFWEFRQLFLMTLFLMGEIDSVFTSALVRSLWNYFHFRLWSAWPGQLHLYLVGLKGEAWMEKVTADVLSTEYQPSELPLPGQSPRMC